MKLRHLFLGILLVVSFLGCSKEIEGTKASQDQLNQTVGLYKATGEKMKAANMEFFIITADKSLYTLQKNQNKYDRTYQGDVNKAKYTFSNNKFESADVIGEKIASTEASLPDDVKLLATINDSAVKLMVELNKENLGLEVRPQQTSISFTVRQREIVDALLTQKAVLISYMKENKLKAFWINDYTNTTLYTKDSNLLLPAGYTETVEKAVEQLTKREGIEKF